jgi:hypothetical protein
MILAPTLTNAYIGLGSTPSSTPATPTPGSSFLPYAYGISILAQAYGQNIINGANADIAHMQAMTIRDVSRIKAQSIRDIAAVNAGMAKDLAGYQAESVRIAAESNMQSMQKQAAMQRAIAGVNERMALMGADRAREVGQQALGAVRAATDKLVGKERASAAAAGIRVDFGSIQDIQEETKLVGDIDSSVIKTNTFREVWGYKNQALNATYQGEISANRSLYEAALSRTQGNLLPSAIREQGSMEATILNMTGNAQAQTVILGGNLQALDADTISGMYARRAIAGPLNTILGGVANYALNAQFT